MVEPNEIKYLENEVFLSVYNPISAQIQDINFNSIIKIEQHPLNPNPKSMLASVTYKIKDNLAKAYKLREGEKTFANQPRRLCDNPQPTGRPKPFAEAPYALRRKLVN